MQFFEQLQNYNRFLMFLQQEYERRCEKNPQYSLRAFAKALDMHAACLSVILRGKRPLTPRMVKKICDRLQLSPEEREDLLAPMEHASLSNTKVMALEVFAMMSQWYYDAICELIRLPNFKPDPKWVSKVLNVPISEIHTALERLVKYEFIEIQKNGNWKLLSVDTDLHVNDFTDIALKKLQKKLLELSSQAIDEVPIERRHHASMTMAISVDEMPEAKKMLRKFKQQFCNRMQKTDKKMNDVYLLNLGFFPITTLKGNRK